MALGDPYATLEELKGRLSIGDMDEIDDTRLTSALLTASRGIEKECRRQFNDAEAAAVRLFIPRYRDRVDVGDFSTTDGLVVATDSTGDGTYEVTWDAVDYDLRPLNGIVSGESGWPYSQLRGVRRGFPCTGRAALQVTARWGWAAVPAPIKEACLVVASETFKLKDAPFGVAGYGEYGAVRVRANPIACQMIAPYRHKPVLVG